MNKPKSTSKKPYYKGKGRNPKYRGKQSNTPDSKDNMSDSKCSKPGDVNNPGYYYDNTTVLGQVMNFSFNEYGNVPIEITFDDGTVVSSYNPMVCSYYLNPCVPQTDGGLSLGGYPELSGVTTAALRNYTYLSGGNNKSTIYAPQDVILVTLAVSSTVSMATWLSRNLGTPYLYNYRNRSYPDMLLRSAKIDADDFRAHLAEYRIRFNTLLAVANKIPFPASISCIAKASEIYGSYYLDDDNSSLAQTYVFNPYTVWTYNETYNAQGAGLDTTAVCSGAIQTFDKYLDIFENQLSALLNSTALNAVYSDIIRLVQAGKLTQLLVFNPIPENFTVIPVYNSEIETWVHNAVIAGAPLLTANQYDPASTGKFTDRNDVESAVNTNTIKYHPQWTRNTVMNEVALIDFDHDAVSEEDKVRATRLSFRCSSMTDSGTGTVYSDNFAALDYYITHMDIFLNSDPNTTPITFNRSMYSYNTISKAQITTFSSAVSRFDWSPLIYFTDNPTAPQSIATVGDTDYYTLLDYRVIRKIYDYEVIHYLQIG